MAFDRVNGFAEELTSTLWYCDIQHQQVREQYVALEDKCGDFKAIESESGREESVDNEDVISSVPLVPGGAHSVHIVKPNLQWCTYGIWQDCLYPCCHGCAVFQKWDERDF